MITQFECQGFRNIACSGLKFSRINLLIGSNNAGKSNFIRALSFAANMVRNVNSDSTGFFSELQRNGWNSVANRQINLNNFRLSWNFDLKDEVPVAYTLRVNVGDHRTENFICEESLDRAEARVGSDKPYNFFRCHQPDLGVGLFSSAGMTSARNKRLRADVNKYETVLLQMDKLFFSNKEMFSTPFVRDDIRQVLECMRKYFQSFYSYSCTAFNLASIREMQDIQNDGSFLKKDGSNFANVFSEAMAHDEQFLSRYRRALCRLIDDNANIYPSHENGKVWLNLEMRGMTFSLSEVSDGTVHLLLLLLLLNLPEKNSTSMLAIDEPEMNLHPAWQKMLANEILHCGSFEQCFISTHSPDFLDEFTENFLQGDVSLFVFDTFSKTPIRQLNLDELKFELQEWTLGDLYRIGDPAIGGWPQ